MSMDADERRLLLVLAEVSGDLLFAVQTYQLGPVDAERVGALRRKFKAAYDPFRIKAMRQQELIKESSDGDAAPLG